VLRSAHGMDAELAASLAAGADGSVSRALAQEAGAFDDARRTALMVLERLGTRPTLAVRLDCAQQLASPGKKAEGAKKKAAGTEREVVGRRLDALAILLRDLAGVGQQCDTRVLANPDLEASLAPLARQFDGQRAVQGFRTVEQARRALERNQSAKVVADWVAVEL